MTTCVALTPHRTQTFVGVTHTLSEYAHSFI